jgi:hypothetical protein
MRVSGLGLMIKVNGKEFTNLFIDNDGTLTHNQNDFSSISRKIKPNNKEIISLFMGIDSLEMDFLRESWDLVSIAARESEIIEVMKIINPNFLEIVPLIIQPGFLVASTEFKQRVPLGSLGEGMCRIFALALALFRSTDGILLIDEIDTGLHYSVMGDMWRVVVETAIQNNIQVFATTHSQDCVNGLRGLCDNYPELRKEVYLHKIDGRLEKAITMDGSEIEATVGMEVR